MILEVLRNGARRVASFPTTFVIGTLLFYSASFLGLVHVGTRDRLHLVGEIVVEHHGVFGTIWASLGMTAYYMALTWINILLGLVLGPLFMIPLTWVQDAFAKK